MTKEVESREDRKERKEKKKNGRVKQELDRLSAGNQALCIIPTQQPSSDGT